MMHYHLHKSCHNLQNKSSLTMSTPVSLGNMTLRPQQSMPEHLDGVNTISNNDRHLIKFKHPAYTDESSTFLTLSAFDHPDGGLHYNTAKIACGIIAGNKWNGYFTAERGGQPIDTKDDDIIPCGTWYFHLPGYTYGMFYQTDCRKMLSFRADTIDTSYPITPNFREWRFPHDDLPPNWHPPPDVPRQNRLKPRSDTSFSAGLRDAQQCRVSGRTEQCCTAHIIPVEENEWFHTNQMSEYVLDYQRRSQSAITDVNNLMLMRSDLHTAFDKAKKFVFVPKNPRKNQSNMVTHLLSYSEEYTPLYHNTLAYSLDLIPRPYLFARFAWAIFPQVEPFLLSRVVRSLVTVSKEQHIFNAEECKEFTVPRGTRSGTGSPKKRVRTTKDDNGCERPEGGTATKRVKLITTEAASQISSEAVPQASVPALSPSSSHSSTDVNFRSSTDANDPSQAPDATYAGKASATIPVTIKEGDSPPRPRAVEHQQSSQSFDDTGFDWSHFYKLREQALRNERQKSDPGGKWLEEVSWAMDVLRNEHSAHDIQSWAYVDEAKRVLGEVDESRNWVKEEDKLSPQI